MLEEHGSSRSTRSSRLARLARLARQSRTCRVESSRVESSQVEFEPYHNNLPEMTVHREVSQASSSSCRVQGNHCSQIQQHYQTQLQAEVRLTLSLSHNTNVTSISLIMVCINFCSVPIAMTLNVFAFTRHLLCSVQIVEI